MKRFWFDIDEGNEAIISSLSKEIGVQFHEMTARRMSRFSRMCGNGFGDHVWRINYAQQRIEASFSKPCMESKKLKSFGFKWLHEDGIWYAPNLQEFADNCESLGLSQVESVMNK